MDHDAHNGAAAGDDRGTVSVEELERERLITYVDWGEVEASAWYWPVYAAAIAMWFATYDLGGWWSRLGPLAVVVVMLLLVRSVTSRSGVSTPRFRGMPSPLRRTFLPLLVVALLAVVLVLIIRAVVDDPSWTLVGLVVGPAMGVAGAWNAHSYRRVARRIAREQGISR